MAAKMWKYNLASELLVFIVGSVLIISQIVEGFPDGAPGQACVRHKPNHGGKAQPLTQMPFDVTASSSTYKPNETIAGEYINVDYYFCCLNIDQEIFRYKI